MRLVKVFTEVRFPETILFKELKVINSIIKEMKNFFPICNHQDNQGMIICLNPEKQINAFINSTRVIVNVEKPNEITDIKTVSKKIIPPVLKRLEIDETEHIGVRAYYIDERYDNEKDCKEIISKKFLNIDNSFLKHTDYILPRAGLSIKVNREFLIHINIGLHQTGTAKINEKGKLEPQVTKTYPLIDLDMLTTEPKNPDQLNGVITYCCSEITKYPHKVWGD